MKLITGTGRTLLATAWIMAVGFCVTQKSHAQSGAPNIDEVRSYVRYLASDELEGRRTGTRGNLLAAGYIAGTFAENGVQPVDGAYFHPFPYASGVRMGTNNHVALIEPTREFELNPGTDFVPLGFSRNGTFQGDLAFVGYGISAPDKGYDDYAGIDVTDKIVVMFRYSPDGDDFHSDLYQHSTFPQKVITATKKGAAGIVMLDAGDEWEPAVIPLTLNRGFKSCDLPVVSIYPTFFRNLQDGKGRTLREIRKAIADERKPNSFQMNGYSIKMATDVVLEEVEAFNVLGMVPGNDPAKKNEIIVIGGHFDHLGHGGEGSLYRGEDSAIHNGADDNASGTAAVMALARYYARTGSNKRTMIFMAFNGEEEGLLGSAAIMEDPPFENGKVIAMLNLDMVGRLSGDSLIVQGTGTSDAWPNLIEKANIDGLNVSTVKDGYGPSDHSSFYAKNIPVLFFFTGLHSDYHRPSDDWDLVNYQGLVSVARFVQRTVDAIDAMPNRPSYIDVPRPVSNTSRMRVVLGVIPDYGFDGEGLRITAVSDGGPAKNAGLQGGDIIVKLNATDVGNIYEYMDALGTIDPGDEVPVEYVREGKRLKSTVKPTGSR